MNRPAVLIPLTIILNACVWAFAIVMSAHALSGTGAYDRIQPILAGCTITSIIVVGGGMLAAARMLKGAGERD